MKRKRTWFLAPVGARIRKGEPDWDTVVTGTEIRRLEETFGGSHILYAFDACYAGMQVKTDAPKKQRVKSAYAIVAGRGGDPVLDEGGKGHSFFTESLAMRCRAGLRLTRTSEVDFAHPTYPHS